MSEVLSVFSLYLKSNPIKSFWVLLRLLILPYNKLSRAVPKKGLVVDIGCGSGFLSQYLAHTVKARKLVGIDTSPGRIKTALLANPGKKGGVSFKLGDASKIHFPQASCFLLVDVLHHIHFQKQLSLLTSLVKQMNKNCYLVIKEVDPSNLIPFLFGQAIEKVLYPHETIFTRSKQDWVTLISSLGLKVDTVEEFFYFPDSTIILVCRKVKG